MNKVINDELKILMILMKKFLIKNKLKLSTVINDQIVAKQIKISARKKLIPFKLVVFGHAHF